MKHVVLVGLVALVASGCTVNYHVEARNDRPTTTRNVPNHPPARPAKKDTPAKFHVPPGHLPKDGQCRIWIPGVPPGQQAPAGDCGELAGEVPPGAWLIRGSHKKSKVFDVEVYHERRPNLVVEIRVFNKKDGSFVRFR